MKIAAWSVLPLAVAEMAWIPYLVILGILAARFLWWRFRPYTDAEYEAVWRASR